MNSRVLGLVRRDHERSLPRPEELPADLFGGREFTVLHKDEELLLLATLAKRPAAALVDRTLVVMIGGVESILRPGYEGEDPNDPRVLLRLWRECGDDFMRDLDGHHVIIVKDGVTTRIYQDLMPGILNVHWCEHDGRLLFCDRIRPLLKLVPKARSLDPAAVQEYLGRSYICAPRTAFSGVKRLVSGTALMVDADEATVVTHDAWRRTHDAPTDETEALRTYRDLLSDALGSWLAKDPACGFLLSGGLDSSVNVALGSEHSERPLRTFGVAAEKFHTDAPYARRVAEQYHSDYLENPVDGSEIEALPRILWHMENLFFEPGLMLTWCALSATAPHVRTVVGGETADQLFGACAVPATRRYEARRRLGPLFGAGIRLLNLACRNPLTFDRPFFRKVENKLAGRFDVANWCGRYGFRECDLVELLRAPLRGVGLYDGVPVPDGDLEELFDFGCVVLNRDYALEGILIANGRLGDALGLETFSPFLSRKVSDFILGLPWNLRTLAKPGAPGDFVYKRLHRLLAYECLPRDLVDRPKQGGAINTMIHFQDPTWCDLVKRAVLASPVLDELCRRPVMAALFDDVAQHATRIMMLVALDLWSYLSFEMPCDDEPPFGLSEFLASRAGRGI